MLRICEARSPTPTASSKSKHGLLKKKRYVTVVALLFYMSSVEAITQVSQLNNMVYALLNLLSQGPAIEATAMFAFGFIVWSMDKTERSEGVPAIMMPVSKTSRAKRIPKFKVALDTIYENEDFDAFCSRLNKKSGHRGLGQQNVRRGEIPRPYAKKNCTPCFSLVRMISSLGRI